MPDGALSASGQKRNGDGALQQRASKRLRLTDSEEGEESAATRTSDWNRWSLMGMLRSIGDIVLSPPRAEQAEKGDVKEEAAMVDGRGQMNGFHQLEPHKQQEGYRRKQAMFEREVSKQSRLSDRAWQTEWRNACSD